MSSRQQALHFGTALSKLLQRAKEGSVVRGRAGLLDPGIDLRREYRVPLERDLLASAGSEAINGGDDTIDALFVGDALKVFGEDRAAQVVLLRAHADRKLDALLEGLDR